MNDTTKPCWCNDDQTTGGHSHGVAWNCTAGKHEWLPWVHRGGSAYTRCVHCGRVEQWDFPEANIPQMLEEQ